MHPSRALYQSLQMAFEHFNRELFEDQLPEVIFTVQRQQDVLGYFAPDRWVSPEGERCHEIAINPVHMSKSRVIEVMQTLVHEMVHCWQHCFGDPGRSCYHNREWAFKMMDIGLQPSTTGRPGGAITGQHMDDYPLEDGLFLKACHALVRNQAFRLPWIYRLALPKGLRIEPLVSDEPEAALTEESLEETGVFTQPQSAVEQTGHSPPEVFLYSSYEDVLPVGSFYTPPEQKRSKVKYQCPGCFANVWGKPNLLLICGQCQRDFEVGKY